MSTQGDEVECSAVRFGVSRHKRPASIGQSVIAEQLRVNGLEMATAYSEQILDGPMHGEKPLSLGCEFESVYPAFPFPRGLVRDRRNCVEPGQTQSPCPMHRSTAT